MLRESLSFITIFSLICLSPFSNRAFSAEISFNRDIRPILSSKCFFCHGPSEKSRKAKLRLDIEEEAFREKDEIAAFVRNSLEDSEAWHRITSDDPDEVMPPPEFKKELTKVEINTIKAWIEQGAKWEGHWAFIPVNKQQEPKTEMPQWIRNPIDSFVLKTLKQKDLHPSPEADRRTLLRRIYFDMTGLPPTPEEINDFLLDHSPQAYEKVVDRLLASDAYAERMTLVWMDAARYGDTSVFHDDGPRDMWPWRDWILNAYKSNMPFDQFTIEQLAGDLLPSPSDAQKIASGFNRNHATTDEGGVIPEEFRVEYVVDRVKTTGNVWMGLTMECAQCHDHKYDPISQEEYFKFYAFYNNNADPGMQTRRGNTAPMVEVITPKRKKQLSEANQAVEVASSSLQRRRKESLKSFDQWTQQTKKQLEENPQVLDPQGLVAHLPFDQLNLENNTSKVGLKGAPSCILHHSPKSIKQAKFSGGIKIENNSFAELPNFGDFEHNQAFSMSAWIKTSQKNLGGAILSKMNEGNQFRGYDLWLDAGRPGTHIVHAWPDNALKIVSKKTIPANKWVHLCVTYSGQRNANAVEIYMDGTKQEKIIATNTLKANTIKTDKPFRIGRRFKSAQVNGTEIDEVRVYNRTLSLEEIKVIMSLPYQSIPEPSGLTAGLTFDSFEGNKTNDIAKPSRDLVLHGGAKQTELGKSRNGLKIENNGFLESTQIGKLEHNQSFSWSVWIKTPKNLTGAILSKMDESQKHRGYDIWLEGGKVGMHIVNEFPDNALKAVSKKPIPVNQWHHLTITYDGKNKGNGLKVYLNGKTQPMEVTHDSLTKTISTSKAFRIGRRFNGSSTNGLEMDELRLYSRVLSTREIDRLGYIDPILPLIKQEPKHLNPAQRNLVIDYYLNRHDPGYKQTLATVTKKRQDLNALKNKKLTSMIMGDNPPNKMRKTYVLMRGQYASPDESKEILPDTPSFLPPMKKDLPKNRLGLAKWLMDKDHPLTARVTVNRYWQTIFGRPLVSTPGDFGSQGSWPSHPDLLSWLAKDFIDHNWNVKRTIKQMVMSSTYRQSSETRAVHMEKDPVNLYHARAPRFRLMGEFVRDNALSLSGLLNRTFGGPGVKPYQPPGLWNEVSLNGGLRFVRDNGDKLYRRSMYTYWKRSAPHPGMMAFDTPSRETCTLQRQRTNTPMQALVTLNDEQFVEASRAFAQRILKSPAKSFSDRLDFAFELATGRPADSIRKEVLRDAHSYQSKIFQAEPKRAVDLLKIGETSRDSSIPAQEHATWTVLASMILNLDETLNRE
ncbi:DUF1553 domain-containing protein [Candidatus Seribacter sulfatis]|uniref:DUF1553 domain-containing protein n=1 Tax=Candidatus Seribacter sulfatis TaxID=3381756 RepID=UPI00389B0FA5